jgi:hypothetical protein
MKIENIIDGWQNFMMPTDGCENLAKYRAVHCVGCEHAKKSNLLKVFVKDKFETISGYICSKCKCPLSAKLRSINETYKKM